jgi:hypothetical protein
MQFKWQMRNKVGHSHIPFLLQAVARLVSQPPAPGRAVAVMRRYTPKERYKANHLM